MIRVPDSKGHFGIFGGRYVPETLMTPLQELEFAFKNAIKDRTFKKEFLTLLHNYAGRPTNLYYATRLSSHLKTLKVYCKREDLLHTGAHKINNTLGQVLLAKKMGKKRIIAETGAGQHGVATATAAALFNLPCDVYMGSDDISRQALNVDRMRLLGTKVVTVDTGSCTLKDSMNEAIRDWVSNIRDTFYCIGSVAGPHPYPLMVREFQKIIGKEARRQFLKMEGVLPDYLLACIGGGSNAMGLFYPFLNDEKVNMIGVEAEGLGIHSGRHAAAIKANKVGVLHGSKSYLMQTEEGQIQIAHSIAAGLDYPGVGPEHSYLNMIGRVKYVSVTDKQAIKGIKLMAHLEGVIPAMETAHAIAYLERLAATVKRKATVILCFSGRGDKDMVQIKEYL